MGVTTDLIVHARKPAKTEVLTFKRLTHGVALYIDGKRAKLPDEVWGGYKDAFIKYDPMRVTRADILRDIRRSRISTARHYLRDTPPVRVRHINSDHATFLHEVALDPDANIIEVPGK